MSCATHPNAVTNRCSGHCCRRFHLPFSMAELKAERDSAMCWLFGAPMNQRGIYNPIEIIRVAAMVIPLNSDGPPGAIPLEGWRYTCKHHNTETGDCMNYENRPKLCSEYPYGQQCTFEGCTWEEARNPPVPVSRLKLHNVKRLADAVESLAAADEPPTPWVADGPPEVIA